VHALSDAVSSSRPANDIPRREAAATALVVAGVATIASSCVLFLLTFWFFFAFLWAAPAAIGAWQVAVARRLRASPSDDDLARRAAIAGAVAGAMAGVNPVSLVACGLTLRWLGPSQGSGDNDKHPRPTVPAYDEPDW
jgi:hypothetical protein